MSASKRKIKIGLVGFGVVGQGVWKHLRRHGKALSKGLGVSFEVSRIAVRDLSKPRAVKVPDIRLTDSAMEVANDPEIDILCELMGGTKLAKRVTVAALKSGKIVVTANKALLSECGEELFKIARENGGHIFFEASVGGGIPIIKSLREGLVVNEFPLIYGILNGTCNYILTRIEEEKKTFEEIVVDARRLGYVEADESLDLDGWDTAHKAAILAWLAHGRWVSMDEMPVEGIRDVSLEDVEWAQRLGYKIKLLATITRDLKKGELFVSVHPTLVPKTLALSSVDGVFNGVSIHGDIVGESVLIGRGAGQDPTASAVISDIVDAAKHLVHIITPVKDDEVATPLSLTPLADVKRAFYVRMNVDDRPGVLSDVSRIFASHNISIESVLQMPASKKGGASLVLTTHLSSEGAIQNALQDLGKQKSVNRKPFLLRIANFEN